MSKHCGSSIVKCGLCGVTGKSFRFLSEKSVSSEEKNDFTDDFRKMVLIIFFTLLFCFNIVTDMFA